MRRLIAMGLVAGAVVFASSACLAGFDISHYGGVGDQKAESADQKAGSQVYGTWKEGANYRVAWQSTLVVDKGSGKNSWVLGTKVDVAANGTYMILQEVRTYYTKAQWKAAYPKDDPGKLGYAPFDADGDRKADGYVSPLKNRPPVNSRTGRPESSGFTMKIGWNVADPGDPDAANAKEAIDLMGTMAGDPNVVVPSTEEIDQKARLAQSRQHGERGIALGNNLYALSRGGIGGAKGMNGLDSPKGPGTGPVLNGGNAASGDEGGGASQGSAGVAIDKGALGSAGYLKGGALGAATEQIINKGAPNLGLEQGSFGKRGAADKASADAMINAGQLAGGLGTGPAGAGKSDAGRQQGGVTAGAGAQQGGQVGGSSSVGTDTMGQWDRTHQGSFGDSGFGSAGGASDAGGDTGGGSGAGDAAGDAAGTAGTGGGAPSAGDAGAAGSAGGDTGGVAGAAGEASAGTPGFGQGEANEAGGGVTSGSGGGGMGAGQMNEDGSSSWQDAQGNTYTDYGDGTMDVTHHDQPIEWTEDGQKKTGTGDVTVSYGQNEDGSYSRTSDEGSASNVQGSNGEDRDDLDGMPVDVTTQDTDSGGDTGGSGGSTDSGDAGGSTNDGGSTNTGDTGNTDTTSGGGEGEDGDDDDADGDDTAAEGGDGSGSMTNPYDDDPDSGGGGLPFALGGEVLREGLRERIMGAVEYTPGNDDDGEGGRGPAPNSGLAANAALREQLFGMVGFQPGDVGNEGGGGTGPKPNTGSVFSRIISAIKSFLGFGEEKPVSSGMLGRGASSFRLAMPIGLTVGSSPGADGGGDVSGGGVTLGPDGKPVKGPTTGPNTSLGTQSGKQQQIQR